MDNQFKVLDINVSLYSISNILEIIEKYLENAKRKTQSAKLDGQKPLVIFTPNPEIVMYAQKEKLFRETVNKAQINIPDGTYVVWAGKQLGYPITERITGADLAQQLVILAEKQQVTVGLIGGFSGLAVKALECLESAYPRLKGWGEDGPVIKLKIDYGDWDIERFCAKVKKSDTKILFVGLGFPKQEYFINEISKKLDNIILMAVGGTFNYWSGRIPRAPLWMQKSGVEWLYRLIKEPWRLRRQLVLPGFAIRVLIHKIVKTLKLNQ